MTTDTGKPVKAASDRLPTSNPTPSRLRMAGEAVAAGIAAIFMTDARRQEIASREAARYLTHLADIRTNGDKP